MIIKFQISVDANLQQILDKLTSNGIDVVDQSVTMHGNYELTVIADDLHKVELISSIYFG